MSAKRAAGYCGGALLLLAWLSSANGLVWQTSDVPPSTRPVETSGTETLAADVHAQAEKLKTRLAAAPAPQQPVRNPFAFAPREASVRRERRVAPVAPLPVGPIAAPDEPAIELIGVAENHTGHGIERTAVISALSGELFLVKEGETIAARYRVKAIGADAVELSDLVSGVARRLALRE
jgi:hypothetical protein